MDTISNGMSCVYMSLHSCPIPSVSKVVENVAKRWRYVNSIDIVARRINEPIVRAG